MVNVSESLPTLIRRPGLTHWVPSVSRDLQFFDNYEQYVASLPGGRGTARLVQSHWPPTPAEELCLDRWWDFFLAAEHFYVLSHDPRQHSYLPPSTGYGWLLCSRTATQTTKGITKVYSPPLPSLRILNVHCCREGKRSAQDSDMVPDVKKARLDGAEDVLMAPATDPPKRKSVHCPFHERN